MKCFNLLFPTMLVLLLSPLLHADPPVLDAGVLIQNGAGPLDVGPYEHPSVIDWNNDGLKDLVVGQYLEGHIYLFLNQGTDLNPVFDGGTLIESAGEPITTTFF